MSRNSIEWRRIVAIVVVLSLLAAAGVANSLVRASRDRAAAARPAVDSAIDLSRTTVSDAWYCAGPLPIGAGTQSSSIALENIAGHPVRGRIEIDSASGASIGRAIDVAPYSQATIFLPRTGKRGEDAVVVLLDGGGVGVSEVVHGALGIAEASCADHAAPTSYLPAGSSRDANNVALAIFDPSATPAVVNVSVTTPNGAVAPAQFQGLPVPAGGVVDIDLGHYVPQQSMLSTTVTSEGGWVVAGEQMVELVNRQLLGQLVTGSSEASDNWWFAPAPSGTGARDSFAIANQSGRATVVELHLYGSGATLTQTINLAAGQATLYTPQAAPGAQSLRFVDIVSSANAPVIVERETVAASAIPATPQPSAHASAAARGRVSAQPLTRLLGLQPGFVLSGGIVAPSRRVALAGGESDPAIGESVLVANPTDQAVTVAVATLGGPKGSVHLVSARLDPFGCEVIDAGAVAGLAHTLPLEVSSPTPIVAAALLYARGSSGSLGFSASVGIPVG